ncbi:MAG: pseudoazurin [Pseudomonadota bacterium]
MKFTRRDAIGTMVAATAVAAVPGTVAIAEGTVHEVQMLNAHPEDKKERQVFYPDIVRAMPGDTIRFISVDKGHNAASDKKMIPSGGEEWKGKIGGDVEITITTEGAYGYNCTPHSTVGMVGLILVGDVSGNYDDIKGVRQRGKAKQRYEDIFARADAMLAEETA